MPITLSVSFADVTLIRLPEVKSIKACGSTLINGNVWWIQQRRKAWAVWTVMNVIKANESKVKPRNCIPFKNDIVVHLCIKNVFSLHILGFLSLFFNYVAIVFSKNVKMSGLKLLHDYVGQRKQRPHIFKIRSLRQFSLALFFLNFIY